MISYVKSIAQRINRSLNKYKKAFQAHELKQYDVEKRISERLYVVIVGLTVVYGVFLIIAISYIRANNIVHIPEGVVLVPIALLGVLFGMAAYRLSTYSPTSFAGATILTAGAGWVFGAAGLFGEEAQTLISILFVTSSVWLSALISPTKFKQSLISGGNFVDWIYAFFFYAAALAFSIVALPGVLERVGISTNEFAVWELLTILIVPFTVMTYWQHRLAYGPISIDGAIDTGAQTFIVIIDFRIRRRTGVKITASANNDHHQPTNSVNRPVVKGEVLTLKVFDLEGYLLKTLRMRRYEINIDLDPREKDGYVYSTTDASHIQISGPFEDKIPLGEHEYVAITGELADY